MLVTCVILVVLFDLEKCCRKKLYVLNEICHFAMPQKKLGATINIRESDADQNREKLDLFEETVKML